MRHIYILFAGIILCLTVNAQSYNAEILNYSTDIFFNGKSIHEKKNLQIKINNTDGLEYSKNEIPVRAISDIKNIDVFLTDPDGKKIKKLKKKDLILKSDIDDGSFYMNDFKYTFNLVHNEFPYILNLSYEKVYKEYITIDYWHPIYYSKIPVNKASLRFTTSNPEAVHINEYLISYESKTLLDNGQTEYLWNIDSIKPVSEENFYPSFDLRIPHVVIYPDQFFYHIEGSSESWGKYGEFIDHLNSGLNDIPKSEEIKIDQIIEGKNSKKEKIDALYKYLQEETRYVNVSINEGGMKSYPASYVCEKKYGDCKALSNYLKSLLEYAGIESNFALINGSRKVDKIEMESPVPQFNHMILFVPMEEDSMWIDATSDYQCGYVGTFIQNRYALIINGENSYFKKTPALTKENVKEERNFYIKALPSNIAETKVRTSFKGRKFESLYYLKENFEKNRKLEILQDYFLEDNMQAPEEFVFSTSYENNEIFLDYHTISNSLIKSFGNDIVYMIPKFDIPSFSKPKYRDFDVQIDFPIYFIDKISIEKPINRKVISLPQDSLIEREYGYYNVQITENKEHFIIEKSFFLNNGYYSLTDYEDFYSFIRLSKKLDHQLKIIFN